MVDLVAKWEEIIFTSNKVLGSRELEVYETMLKTYGQLIGKYLLIRSMLLKLLCDVDRTTILQLQAKGYKINVASSESYAESVAENLHRTDNFISKINTQRNLIIATQEQARSIRSQSFPELIAGISKRLGFQVRENITLSEFNEYQRLLRQKKNGRGQN